MKIKTLIVDDNKKAANKTAASLLSYIPSGFTCY
jgi:hypothetical protein